MASSISYFLFFSSLLFISSSNAQSSFRPHALVIPVSKDSSTLQYVTSINQRTPLVPLQLVVDLGGQFLWVDCEQNYRIALPSQFASAFSFHRKFAIMCISHGAGQLFLPSVLFCKTTAWSGEFLERIQWCLSMVMCCALDLLMEEQTPELQLLLEGTSWRITFYSLIWLHQGLGSAPLSSSAKPHAPTSTSHPIKPFRRSSHRFNILGKRWVFNLLHSFV
ncbi:unnamed protein product, partial [Vitis vinifera]